MIFRGYLQRQFTVLTKSIPAGILLSGATFGAAHAYQGFRMVILSAYTEQCSGLRPLAWKRSAWNDRPRVAGFTERSTCWRNQTLEFAWCLG